MDAGAGPGWASLDLAEIVGPEGKVHALERSERFLEFLDARGRAARPAQHRHDHARPGGRSDLPVEGADAFWIRWVLAFVSDPRLVLQKLAATLRPGGVAIIHEYLDYGTFSFAPDLPGPKGVRRSRRNRTGAPPAANRTSPAPFHALLPETGFRIKSLRPIVDVVSPGNYVWQWPASFVKNYPQHLVETGQVDQAWADRVIAEFETAEADPNTVMVTPMVLEVIAEKTLIPLRWRGWTGAMAPGRVVARPGRDASEQSRQEYWRSLLTPHPTDRAGARPQPVSARAAPSHPLQRRGISAERT